MIFRLVLGAHLACAFGATLLFWVPVAARKGGPLHLRAGRLYARLIYATALTGAPLAVVMFVTASDAATRHTAAFLAYLIIILVQPVHHGVRVVRLRGRTIDSPLHTALAVAAIAGGLAIGVAAIAWRQWPFLLMAPIGPVMGWRALATRNRTRLDFPASSHRENRAGFNYGWREEHIIAMSMSGIAVHTAMLVFGTSRTLHMTLSGLAAYVPWLAPAVIGLPLLLRAIRRERQARA